MLQTACMAEKKNPIQILKKAKIKSLKTNITFHLHLNIHITEINK